MHPASAFSFARLAQEYARWRGVPDDKRSDAPAWWWGPAMAVRHAAETMPHEVAGPFALPAGASYGDAARRVLAAFGDQAYQPWPDYFPEKFIAKVEDPAPSAEPAAQAASAAVVPIA